MESGEQMTRSKGIMEPDENRTGSGSHLLVGFSADEVYGQVDSGTRKSLLYNISIGSCNHFESWDQKSYSAHVPYLTMTISYSLRRCGGPVVKVPAS